MLKFTPLKTWICCLTKQAWDADGSRSSRRVDVAKVKKELMGSVCGGHVGYDGFDGVDGGFDGGVDGGSSNGSDVFDGLGGFDDT